MGSIEYDCLIAVEKHSVVEVPPYGARQYHAFKVPAFLDQVLYLITVRNPGDVLLDNRTFIQGLRHIVTCSANELDAAFKGCVVGFRSSEGG